MYGILPSTDFSFLRGKTLIQVCFGPCDLQLNFAEETTNISIESTLAIRTHNQNVLQLTIGDGTEHDSVLRNACPLLSLLMTVVEEVSWTSEGALTLQFPEERRLTIFDDSSQFESYVINHNGQTFIV